MTVPGEISMAFDSIERSVLRPRDEAEVMRELEYPAEDSE
jgi:hypothetical protein